MMLFANLFLQMESENDKETTGNPLTFEKQDCICNVIV